MSHEMETRREVAAPAADQIIHFGDHPPQLSLIDSDDVLLISPGDDEPTSANSTQDTQQISFDQLCPCPCNPSYDEYDWIYVLAIVTLLCCNWLFGLIAFALAGMAQKRGESGDETLRAEATDFAKASVGMSIVGIIISIVVAITCFLCYKFL